MTPHEITPSRPRLFFAILLALFTAIPFSIVRADPAPASNPNAATQPSDLALDQNGWTKSETETISRMRQFSAVAWAYAGNHHDRFPPSLGALISYFKTHRDAAQCCLTPGNERLLDIPAHPTADWINHNTSFIFLAADLDPRKIENPADGSTSTLWAATALIHTRLDQPFQHPKTGGVILITFIDGHTELFPVEKAQQVIDLSKKIVAAVRHP